MEVAFGYDRVMKEKTQNRETLDLPSQPGTYALLLEATTIQDVQIGKLGVLHMLPGIYVYVGSALGPGGLAARIERHARQEKTLRWHIDYLRAAADIEEVGKQPPGVPVGTRARQAAGGVHAPAAIRSVGLRLPVASLLL
jgi:hypothetical protein